MRLRKYVRASAAVAALALALTACGGNGGTTSEESSSPAGGGSESSGAASPQAADLGLINEGTLTICTDAPYPPFEFEEGGKYTGFDIDMIRTIADNLGLDLKVVTQSFDAIKTGTALQAGNCDLAVSAISITEDRKQNLNFSDPYYDAKQSLLVKKDSGITTLDDLSGKTIGVQVGTTGKDYAEEHAPKDATIQEFETGPDLFTALEAGQIDAILQDLPVNAEQARKNDSVTIAEEYDTGEQYGFAAKKEGTDALIGAINEQLSQLRSNGTYEQIYNQYFSTEPGAGDASASESST